MVDISLLAYHRFGASTPVAVDLPVEVIEQQLDLLAAHARVISLDDALAELVGRADLNPATDRTRPTVVLTADDGTADWVEVLLPMLADRQLPMTWYVATRFVEEQRDFPNGGRPVTWASLRDAVSTGLITVGSHTHSHAVMTHLDASTAAEELARSRGLIESALGTPCDHFAYPKAMRPSAAAETEVRKQFTTAALAGNRRNRPGRTDPARLGRTPIKRTDDPRRFLSKVSGGARLEGFLREWYDRFRYQHDVT